ncbi:hypothetical protein [Streptomyces californicus]|uniref:hypothetical protein n=1 Tax=Streptomyces californicus TaxID=67351 RepID=UPI003715C1BC
MPDSFAEPLPADVTPRALVAAVLGMNDRRLPVGTGPESLRVVRAQDVREHDWCVGTCPGPGALLGRNRGAGPPGPGLRRPARAAGGPGPSPLPARTSTGAGTNSW